MTKELIDRVWACLPREFREEVKEEYYDCKHCNADACAIELEVVFGEHNLNSDAEGEEMLIVPRSKVQELFDTGDKYSCSTLAALFGSKCLPDETKDGTMDETKEPKPTGPKFKVGDKVKDISSPHDDGIYKVDDIKKSSDGFIYHIQGLIGESNVKESDLESYTESKNKDSGFIRAESVKELRIASEETHLRNLSQETTNCDKHFDNILKDSFRNERRLNIAAMAMQGLLASPVDADMQSKSADYIVRASFEYADALIAEAQKGGENE